jgi:hypothetical protein
MEANVQKQASSKPVIKTAYPVNEKSPRRWKEGDRVAFRPEGTGAYITEMEREGDFAIGRAVPAGRYTPGFELPPAPYPGPGKVKPPKYVPAKQGSEFDLSELRKYLQEAFDKEMQDIIYIMVPVRKKDLAKYGKS